MTDFLHFPQLGVYRIRCLQSIASTFTYRTKEGYFFFPHITILKQQIFYNQHASLPHLIDVTTPPHFQILRTGSSDLW